MSKTLMTLAQVAEILQVSEARAQQMAREQLLPVIRLGRQYRVDPDALDEFIRSGGRALPGGWRRAAAGGPRS
jgi:putative molybdopterin biosynthesis protein